MLNLRKKKRFEQDIKAVQALGKEWCEVLEVSADFFALSPDDSPLLMFYLLFSANVFLSPAQKAHSIDTFKGFKLLSSGTPQAGSK